MKLSPETLAVLRNYAHISGNLKIDEGNVIRTKDIDNTIYAEATVPESFPRSVRIYDMNQFLSSVDGLFKDPELTFDETSVHITSDGDGYHEDTVIEYAGEGVVKDIPPLKSIPDSDIKFSLSQYAINRLKKAASVFHINTVVFEGKDGSISAIIKDLEDPNTNTFNLRICDYSGDDFVIFMLCDHMLEIIPGNYKIMIVPEMLITAENTDFPIKYVMAVLSHND